MRPFEDIDKIADIAALDRLGKPLERAVDAALRPQALEDALHGVWLGHPLHPAMVQLPVGAWLSAGVLDAVPGAERGADVLIGVGIAGALAAATAGLADWARQEPGQQRVGLVHAMLNTAALGLYTGSLAARRKDRRGLGKLLAYGGLGVSGVSAAIGGHLSYRQGAGVNQAQSDTRALPRGWHDLGPLDDLPEGRPTFRDVEGVRLAVVRRGGDVFALTDRCAHQSGPLHEGEVATSGQVLGARDGEGAELCVVCPWHGSVFRLSDGAVLRGPSNAKQPVLETRVVQGRAEARLPVTAATAMTADPAT